MATTFGKPTKASISARDLGGVSAPYTTMIGSLTCCAALTVFATMSYAVRVGELGCCRPPVKAAQKNSGRDSHPHYNKKRKFSKLQGVESFALLKASTAS